MHIRTIAFCLNTWMIFASTVLGASEREPYIIHRPLTEDPLNTLVDTRHMAGESINLGTYNQQAWVYETVYLTKDELLSINNNLNTINAKMRLSATNKALILKDELVQTLQQSLNFTNSVPSKFIQDAPRCNATVNNIEFIIIDDMINVNHSEFANVKITVTNLYSNVNPSAEHASHIASIIVGKNAGTITKGNRTIHNIVTFFGQSAVTSKILQAFNLALQINQNNLSKGIRSIINYSAGGANNTMINRMATSCVEAGIPTVVAAGNSFQDIKDTSPANADKVIPVAAIAWHTLLPATFTNWSLTKKLFYLPGLVMVVDLASQSGTTFDAGTSFSAPFLVGILAQILALNPNLTPEQLEELAFKFTRPVHTPADWPYLNTTMYLFPEYNACIQPKLYNQYQPKIFSAQYPDWYPVPNIDKFCVNFTVTIPVYNSKAYIELRNSEDDLQPLQISLGMNKVRRKYILNLYPLQKDNRSVSTSTNLPVKTNTVKLQILKFNNTLEIRSGNFKGTYALNDTLQPQLLGFAKNNKQAVTYKNALLC